MACAMLRGVYGPEGRLRPAFAAVMQCADGEQGELLHLKVPAYPSTIPWHHILRNPSTFPYPTLRYPSTIPHVATLRPAPPPCVTPISLEPYQSPVSPPARPFTASPYQPTIPFICMSLRECASSLPQPSARKRLKVPAYHS
eukprot:1762274-Rhodomonas_salina.2